MRFALVQLNPTMGAFSANRERFQALAASAPRDALLMGPELTLSGYVLKDLLRRPDFLTVQDREIERLNAWLKDTGRRALIGRVAPHVGPGYPLENQAVLLDGQTCTVVAVKRLLPAYDVFGEPRYFQPGIGSFVTSLDGLRLGIAVCEDGWNHPQSLYPADPVADLMTQGPDVLVFLNASPSNLNKTSTRRARFASLARQHACPVISVNQVGATDDLVFDGGSFFADRDGTWHAAPLFVEGVLVVDPQRSHTEWLGPTGVAEGADTDESTNDVAGDPAWLAFVRGQLTLGVRDYVRKTGGQRVTVALSGGADSSLVLSLAVEALGADHVTAVTMPSRFSSQGSVTDSEELADLLNVRLYHRPVVDDVDAAVRSFEQAFGQAPQRLTLENLQARIRGAAIMAWANQSQAMVLSTGNKSEIAMGYCTLYGDTNGALNPIGDVYKSEVYRLLRNDVARGRMPRSVVDKAPSAELFPGQIDQDSLPPYATVLDPFLQLYLDSTSLSPRQRNVRRALLQEQGVTPEQALRWARTVEQSEFKRRQSCPIVRLRVDTFGAGRPMPLARDPFLTLETMRQWLTPETLPE